MTASEYLISSSVVNPTVIMAMNDVSNDYMLTVVARSFTT